MNKALIATVLLCLTSACGVTTNKVSPELIVSANYGTYPDNYEALVKDYHGRKLKDPFSAQYQVLAPIEGYTRKAPIAGGEPNSFGYMVLASVNAKNSYGGYTGWKPHWFFIMNGVVAGEVVSNPWFDEPWYR